MKTLLHYAKVGLLPLAILLPLGAQDNITHQQADDILNELRQIRQLLEKLPVAAAPQPSRQDQPVHAKVSVAGRPSLGSKDAPMTMVEYTDYQCPYCRQFHLTTFSELKKDYIDTGKVRFYVKDLPLDFHPNAMNAAQAARCANEQGQFWTLRDTMARNAQRLEMPNITFWAKDLKMDSDALLSCVQSGKYKNEVQSDIAEAMRIGATGTPSFVLGQSAPDGVDGELVIGAVPYTTFDQKLKELELAKAGSVAR